MKRSIVSLATCLVVASLTACGPSTPKDTVASLTADPDRLKEVERLCREEREKVSDALCLRAAEARNNRFFGNYPGYKAH
ncbi:EexN family lipoprotein [Pseudomonas sp. RW10S2]|uniref:EexN family lipoprotein n=1 Tax=Pseudomonas sp. RW10S2 TaxID=459637 RepID=UPI0016496267|nr:EexN family lipoprotein [Pseudomonas sp. RW10S2]MBC3466846.1 EexN family lipoprotein [Pseudomonas sp. RW10S2]